MSDTKLEDFINETLDSVEKFGETLGLEKSFLRFLLKKDDDWAFLIKTHTLVETALAHLINEELNRKEIAQLIEKINIDGRVSKLAFIESMKLLNKPQIAYIKQLGVLRNKAAHNIQSTSISIQKEVSEMSPEDLKKLIVFPVENNKLLTFVKKQPKFVIWSSAMQLLERIYNKKEEIIRQRLLSSNFMSGYLPPTIKGLLG